MLKADWKSLALLFIITFFYIKCATIEYLTDRPADVTPPPRTAKKVSNEELEFREEIIEFAKKYVGSKYRYAGADPNGFDCSGFTSYVLKNFKIPVDRTSRSQANNGRAVDISEVKPGDLLYFSRSSTGTVFHVGMVVENSKDGIVMIHSATNRGVVVDNISHSSYWKPKLRGARDVLNNTP